MSHNTDELKAVSRTTITRRQWIWKEMKKNKVAYAMVAPYMILFTIFTVLPVVLSAFISFTDFNMIDIAGTNIVWFQNYITLFFDDDIFLIACPASSRRRQCTVHPLHRAQSPRRTFCSFHDARAHNPGFPDDARMRAPCLQFPCAGKPPRINRSLCISAAQWK
jgi:hypothetical protein